MNVNLNVKNASGDVDDDAQGEIDDPFRKDITVS